MTQTFVEKRYEMHYGTMGGIYNSRIQEISYMTSYYMELFYNTDVAYF